jgi:NAD(P)-dependent dehydrogenase (short-subunit alcohol dehydrogenase family)
VNVMQIVFAARHLFPAWIERGHAGHFAVTASAAGLLTQVGSLPYSVTKHAAVSVAEWLRIAYRDRGIVVTCACPQAVRTGMLPAGADGGPAGGDGIISADDCARTLVQGMREGTFLVLPHPEVRKHFLRKASDYERWLRGMGRLQAAFGEIVRVQPPTSAAKL